MKDWLNNFGDKVQGDHTFSDESINNIILASHDHINGSHHNNDMLDTANNLLQDFNDSYYLDQCKQLLNKYKTHNKTPIDIICDEIVSERLKKLSNTSLNELSELVFAYKIFKHVQRAILFSSLFIIIKKLF